MAAAVRLQAAVLMTLLQETEIVIEPVTEAQAKIAREAYRDFSCGSGATPLG